jgi:hypothetical protein
LCDVYVCMQLEQGLDRWPVLMHGCVGQASVVDRGSKAASHHRRSHPNSLQTHGHIIYRIAVSHLLAIQLKLWRWERGGGFVLRFALARSPSCMQLLPAISTFPRNAL